VSLKQALFRVGLVIYLLSFFLVATGDREGLTGRLRGYECAYFAVQSPLTSTPFSPDSADYAPPFYIPLDSHKWAYQSRFSRLYDACIPETEAPDS
jgi:hypothetical protein